jgi:ParB-like chromosome segregation protein Spo0J
VEFHEIADAFPMLEPARIDKLADSIRRNGLRHPIVVFEDKILDGRNRYRACEIAGLNPTYVGFDGDWAAAVEFVADENLERRDLTEAQRQMAAAKLLTLGRGRPASDTASEPISEARAAELLGTSRAGVHRARRVVDRGAAELVDAVLSNQIPVSTAAELSKLPEPEQRAVLAEGKTAAKKAAAKLRNPAPTPATKTTTQVIDDTPPVNAEHQERRTRVIVGDLLDQLTAAVGVVEKTAAQLAAPGIELGTDAQHLLLVAADRLRTGAGWITTLVTGEGFSDTALAAWLKGDSG